MKSLTKYPDDWDFDTKGDYLILAVSKHQIGIRRSMDSTKIWWPLDNGHLPSVLNDIIKYQSERNTKYSVIVRFDYLRLVKDTFKHFNKYPPHIKIITILSLSLCTYNLQYIRQVD